MCPRFIYELEIVLRTLPSLPSSVPSLPPNVEGALTSQGLPSSVPSLPPDADDVLDPMRSETPAESHSEAHHDYDMDLEMPTDVPEYDDCPNAFDDCAESDLEDPDIDSELQHLLDRDLATSVPIPSISRQLSTPQDIAELYSPPRVLPVDRQHGQRGCLSLDLMTGWDFNSEAH